MRRGSISAASVSDHQNSSCRFTRISAGSALRSGKAVKMDVEIRAGGHNSLRQCGTSTGNSENLPRKFIGPSQDRRRKFIGPPQEVQKTSTGPSKDLHRKFIEPPYEIPPNVQRIFHHCQAGSSPPTVPR